MLKDMSAMFQDAWLFNSGIENWNVAKVSKMDSMFYNTRGTLIDLSNWDVSSISSRPLGFRTFLDIFEPSWTTTSVDDIQEELPTKLILHQNYPNPFNPQTTISYELPTAAIVRLEVFSMTGQRVATLVDGVQEAGVFSHSFNAQNFPSGIYLYRLSSGNTVLSRKMTLMK